MYKITGLLIKNITLIYKKYIKKYSSLTNQKKIE